MMGFLFFLVKIITFVLIYCSIGGYTLKMAYWLPYMKKLREATDLEEYELNIGVLIGGWPVALPIVWALSKVQDTTPDWADDDGDDDDDDDDIEDE